MRAGLKRSLIVRVRARRQQKLSLPFSVEQRTPLAARPMTPWRRNRTLERREGTGQTDPRLPFAIPPTNDWGDAEADISGAGVVRPGQSAAVGNWRNCAFN
jgi:hypothetical protein